MNTAQDIRTDNSETLSSKSDNSSNSKSFATLFNYLHKNSRSAQLEPVFFLARRILFAALLVFSPEKPLFVSFVLICSSLATLAYLIMVRPYNSCIANRVAIINEMMFAVFIVLIFVTTQVNMSSLLGYTVVGYIVFSIIANLVALFANLYVDSK